ncbi:MAG: hypothetical protein EOP84_36690, partial [Verrucomicrobiaceae bacterium]
MSADAVENFARELLGAPLSQSDRVLLASCIRRLAVEKPDLALELFDESIRQGSMVEPNGLIEDLAKAHPDLLVSHLLKVSPNLREDGVSDRALVYLMARKDGYATDFFVGLSAREKAKYLSMFIGTEFMNDEEGTLEIARTKLGKDERDKAIGEVAGLFASNGDMARARKIIDAIPGGSAKDAAALEAVSAIALRSDHGVVDFSLARDMSAAALNSLFSKEYVMSLLVKRSPDDVLELLEKTVPTASNLNVLSRMAGQLIAENPAKTLDWISSQQEGASKSGLLNAAFAEWVKHDPNAALRQA